MKLRIARKVLRRPWSYRRSTFGRALKRAGMNSPWGRIQAVGLSAARRVARMPRLSPDEMREQIDDYNEDLDRMSLEFRRQIEDLEARQ